MHQKLNHQYYEKSSWIYLFIPLSFIFLGLVLLRRYCYKIGILNKYKIRVPVVVVGNITLGGTGKTSLVMHLVTEMIRLGLKPGVISRGYGSRANTPGEVLLTSKVIDVGDEPLLIKSTLDVPVFVGKDKVIVSNVLLSRYPDVNIIISDDGLQHYKLDRDFEILVMDSNRGFGNGYIFPAGPLREPKSRINSVDAVVINGKSNNPEFFEMRYKSDYLVNSNNGKKSNIKNLAGQNNIAVTAIGNPNNFFEKLSELGLNFKKLIFNDHYIFDKNDFQDYKKVNIVMTEKDAVKCKSFAKKNFWYLPIRTKVDKKLFLKLTHKLGIKING